MVTASRVDYTSLFSQPYNNVLVLLQANLTDPATNLVNSPRKWFYNRKPDTKSISFGGYPFVVIRPSTNAPLGQNTGMQSLDGKHRNLEFALQIEVWTSDRGYGDRDAMGAVDMDTISNQVSQILTNVTNRTTLATNGLFFSNPVASGVASDPLEETMTFSRSFDLTFQARTTVSA